MMADIDGTPPYANWQFNPTKLNLYKALYFLNRGFQITVLSLEHLERLGMFRPEYLNGFKVTIEHTRALANEELMDTLQDFEEKESFHFGELRRAWDEQNLDPDDVFFHVQERRQQIKEQIRQLQKGLQRQRPKRKKGKK